MVKKKNWYTNPRKYHFIYKTTCSVNGKYYYGMHSTDDLEDGYIGSGTRLWHSIKKHGRENFKLEILEFCLDRESLKQREAELITEEMLSDPMCMNLTLGGGCGWDIVNKNSDLKRAGGRIAGKITGHVNGKKNMLRLRQERPDVMKRDNSRYLNSAEANVKRKNTFQLTKHQQGSKNSQFGSCWIYSVIEQKSIKIKAENLEHYLSDGWIKGRKMKF